LTGTVTGAETFVRMLQLHGVKHVFGLCGDYAAVASAFGVKSWRVDDPAQLRGALAAATALGAPALVDVVCQPLQEARAPVSEWIA
jgi:thiamine pyrophosphate-dependent acetolactate synthase large subunit-like protein